MEIFERSVGVSKSGLKSSYTLVSLFARDSDQSTNSFFINGDAGLSLCLGRLRLSLGRLCLLDGRLSGSWLCSSGLTSASALNGNSGSGCGFFFLLGLFGLGGVGLGLRKIDLPLGDFNLLFLA